MLQTNDALAARRLTTTDHPAPFSDGLIGHWCLFCCRIGGRPALLHSRAPLVLSTTQYSADSITVVAALLPSSAAASVMIQIRTSEFLSCLRTSEIKGDRHFPGVTHARLKSAVGLVELLSADCPCQSTRRCSYDATSSPLISTSIR
jgi:hypothetical protein